MPVKDSRISEERGREDLDIMAATSMVRVPTAPPALGDLPLHLAEGTGKVSLNWFRHLGPVREPNSVEEKPLPGQRNTLCKISQWK